MFLYVNSIKKYNLLFYLLIGMDENERRRIRKRTSNLLALITMFDELFNVQAFPSSNTFPPTCRRFLHSQMASTFDMTVLKMFMNIYHETRVLI
jgi:hypothetical protein